MDFLAALYDNLLKDLEVPLGRSLLPLVGKGIYPVGLSVRQRAALSLGNSFLKKFEEQESPLAKDRALSKFLASNDRCRAWELQLNTSMEEELVGTVQRTVHDFFSPGGLPMSLDPISLHRYGDLGPGASVGALGQDFYTKLFASPLSCTSPTLYNMYRRCVSRHDRWSEAENLRSLAFGDYSLVKGNSLSFAKKTTEIARAICKEPTLNMWYQLACYNRLSARLKGRFGIDLATQQFRNRVLACRGSKDETYATIDLESASDSMSRSMLRYLLPKEVYRDLDLLRSPFCRLPDETQVQLELFSSMGNGFTFPLQTVVFAAVVSSVYEWLKIPALRPDTGWGNFGVFGDDIVCTTQSYRLIVKVLNILGFTVNIEKSFAEGPFRESCGGDYFLGKNVRGVYFKRSDDQSIYATLNRLNEFTADTGVAVTKTWRFLRQYVRWRPVPLWENADAGIRTPIGFMRPRMDKNGSYAYKAWRPVESSLRVYDEEIRVPDGAKKRFFNPPGLEMATLSSRLRDMGISVRHDRVAYRLKLAVAPNWDIPAWTAKTLGPSGQGAWKRLETAFYTNL
jgi:hypothetical protein